MDDRTDFPSAPMGERVSNLERGEKETARDISRVERKVDQVLERLRVLELSISQRRGSEGAAAWLLDGIRMIVAAVIGAAAASFTHTFGHP